MRDTLCALTHKVATAIALGTLLSLTACATLESPEDARLSTATSMQRAYSETLDLDGRLSVQYQKDDKDEAIHVSFTWKQSRERNTITILSPLGQILATIAVTPDSATLTQSGQTPRNAADADALAQQALGWPLPVSGLRSWLQGYAIDAGNRAFIASPSNTKVTTRDGWHIRYQSWQDDNQPATSSRPKRIDLERQTEQAGKVAIRIVLDNWQTQ